MVLVHGLYHCPEHFTVVAEGLRAAGAEVVVPELHRGSLPADAAVVQAAVDSLREPPVVLGHSASLVAPLSRQAQLFSGRAGRAAGGCAVPRLTAGGHRVRWTARSPESEKVDRARLAADCALFPCRAAAAGPRSHRGSTTLALVGRGCQEGKLNMTGQQDRWAELTGGQGGEAYAQRFSRLVESGHDIHGEAAFCAALLEPAARVLDAGCGTGRIAIRLAELGHRCTGVDVDPSMLAVARRDAPAQEWLLGDLARLDALGLDPDFGLVLAAGNVIPLLAPGTEPDVVRQLAGALRPGGLLVTGMGLDAAHLPLPEPPLTLGEFDHWCARAGLTLEHRYATWSGDPYQDGCGYAVSVHSRPAG